MRLTGLNPRWSIDADIWVNLCEKHRNKETVVLVSSGET